MRTSGLKGILLACGILALSTSASASPITYGFLTGDVEFTVLVNGSSIGSISLPATSGFVTFDDMTPELLDFALNFSGVSAALPGGIGTLDITSASITPGTGFSSALTSITGTQWSHISGPIDSTVVGSIGPINFSGMTTIGEITGFIEILPNGDLTMSGLKLVEFMHGGSVVELVAEGSFRGTPLPEPSIAFLLLGGVAWIFRSKWPA